MMRIHKKYRNYFKNPQTVCGRFGIILRTHFWKNVTCENCIKKRRKNK